MLFIKIAAKSAWSRKISLILAMLSIAISLSLLFVIDNVRNETKMRFMNTVSGVDLIAGAGSGDTNLLLYSVFHMGRATRNIEWSVYQQIASMKGIQWTIPLSLGDSHKGFRVIGTSRNYFKYYRYGNDQSLALKKGALFKSTFDAVIGYEVAQEMKYKLGQSIVLSHGLEGSGFSEHQEYPFSVVGILKRTGTPVDRSILVSLNGMNAIHSNGEVASIRKQLLKKTGNVIDSYPPITAFMVGLDNKFHIFQIQRRINNMPEGLLAIIPGVTLSLLWRSIGQFEQILLAVGFIVLVSSLSAILVMLLSTLYGRRHEITLLRASGARACHILQLFAIESVIIGVGGCIGGSLLSVILQWILQPILLNVYGLYSVPDWPHGYQFGLMGVVVVAVFIISLIPGWFAARRSLQDGLAVKL
ncbi:hypothetical protein CI610_02197 [invertebrate metagenome]|uniref:Uncharacterized protein n=1 Tax=invertebrate metagenome TaxID=1711999 RepID=A0A2H9T6K8_9ZZZZ